MNTFHWKEMWFQKIKEYTSVYCEKIISVMNCDYNEKKTGFIEKIFILN
jgi:hypothetical protein